MKKFVICLFMCLFIFSGTAYAATATTALSVSASVAAYANVTATGLFFGDSLSSGSHQSTATISVWATNELSYHIALDAGQNYSEGVRHIANEGLTSSIAYYLHKAPDEEDQWGDIGIGDTYIEGTPAGPFISTGVTEDYTVYGVLQIGEGVEADEYYDYVIVTVEY